MSNRYLPFLMESERLNSSHGKKVVLVSPDKLDGFLSELEGDTELSDDFKAVIALGISIGGRIEETLSLKKSQIIGSLVKEIRVLKKKNKEVYRDGKLHPIAERILGKVLSHKRPHEFIFRGLNQAWVLRQVKKTFGENADTHGICRFTHISYLVFLGKEGLRIAAQMKFSSVSVAYSYTAIRKSEIEDLYEDEKKAA
jgi:hypothetical protein